MGVTPPDAVPDADTSATFEDIDGNGIDDDCQTEAALDAPDAVTAELATVDTDADGVISTTEAAHSPRIGGKNCNHGGYVSWIAQHKHDCVAAPTEAETAEPSVEDATVVLVVTTPPDAEPDADAAACAAADETADADSAKKDHAAAAAARLAAKAERTLARAAAKAERTAAKAASKVERNAAKAARAAERQAAKAARAANHKKGH
jgi:hypothetical protein